MNGSLFSHISGKEILSNHGSSSLFWRKMGFNKKEIIPVDNMLRVNEYDYTCACAKYCVRNPVKDPIWMLFDKEKKNVLGLIINSKSTVVPVFCGMDEIPVKKFPVNFFKLKKIHSIQGFKKEVLILEDLIKKTGRKIADFFDYDLMDLDIEKGKGNREQGTEKNEPETKSSIVRNLVIREPRMTDLDELVPLQTAYEHEEVQHKGSIFSPAASRVNLANIIAKGKILIALVNGRIVGKINVSGVSFSRYLVGGVFVHPDYRGQGIAGFMTAEFIKLLVSEGRGVTLFVKKSNAAARKLYVRLGFKKYGDYRITYLD